MLREFPVEARVDPAFEQLDALGSEIERERFWEEWLTKLVAADADEPGVRQVAFAAAARRREAADVQELAAGQRGVFGERYDIDPLRTGGRARSRCACLGSTPRSDRLRGFCAAACSNPEDKGCTAAIDLVEACERLLAEPPGGPRPAGGGALRASRQDFKDGARRRQGQLGPEPRR